MSHACVLRIWKDFKKREREDFNLNIANAKAWAKESKADNQGTKQIMKDAQNTDGAKAKTEKRREDKHAAQV